MIITDQNALSALCTELAAYEFLTVDTEFLREKTYYPKLCLIQIGTPDGQAWAIDVLVKGLDLAPVFALLSDPGILKVFHAARQDLEIFYNLTGQVVAPLFDTQIAAMVCGYGDSVGYESLVRNITGGQLDKSVQFTNWAHRPLSRKQIDYALGDVTHLVGIYRHLSEELERRGRTSWVFEEESILTAPSTYENKPEEAWQRVKIRSPKPKTLAVLRELAAWREKRAQDKDIPRPWVLRDETLADMAAQMPKTPEELKKIRGMPQDMPAKQAGREILDLITKALSSDKTTWPQPEKKNPVPSSLSPVIDILRMLLKIQASENDVAAKLIASADDLEQLALDDKADIPALSGWRYEIFGREALALKKGQVAVGLKNQTIVKYKISKDSDIYE
ncbi:MAG: ribonuclease D [Alphaproteobacteria bacterium]|nr:ribonuclease D [Alphaproteobacteria bacterium]